MKFTKILDIVARYIDKCIERMEEKEKMGHLDISEKLDKKLGLPPITGKNPYRWM
ncbi:MAG: hypothetical protein IMF01_04230 [Proteobacteria bacterium]|nr:hypothetical protein [Pseudomonadota bacterium]